MTPLLAIIKTYVVCTQNDRLTEMILLSTHNIGFGGQIRILEHEKHSLYKSRALFDTGILSRVIFTHMSQTTASAQVLF